MEMMVVAVVLSQNTRLVEVGDDVGRWLRKMERVQKWEVVAVVNKRKSSILPTETLEQEEEEEEEEEEEKEKEKEAGIRRITASQAPEASSQGGVMGEAVGRASSSSGPQAFSESELLNVL
ncbi:unnamed protein product [Arctogadus glacialis]